MYAPLIVTRSLTLTRTYANTATVINAPAGCVLTLPRATGTGDEYEFIFGATVATGTVVIKVGSGFDTMSGVAIQAGDSGTTPASRTTLSDTDSLSFNGGTTGGRKGDTIVLRDVASNMWTVLVTSATVGTAGHAVCRDR